MFQYLVKRLLLLLVTLFGIAAITFVLTRLTPGDPVRVQAQSTGAARTVGGYEDLVELNRRNLGLDKPLLLNLRPSGRKARAAEAIDDFLRKAEFWKEEGESRLARISTIALEPALERYELIINDPDASTGDDDERVMAPIEEQKTRLAELFPRLAAADTTPTTATVTNDDNYRFWKEWLATHGDRFEEQKVAALVDEYLSANDPERVTELSHQVFRAGGYAVPYLTEHLDSPSTPVLARVNRALQAQTGFTFASGDAEFARKSDEVVRRWRSWWRRESNSFQDPGPIARIVNVGLDTQFGLWVSQAALFDFGDSYMQRRPVIDMIGEALPISLLLSGLSILIGYAIAIPLGIFSAVRRHSKADNVVTIVLFVLYSLPSFWVAGILLLTLTGQPFDLFPTRGIGSQGIAFGGEGITTIGWIVDRAWHLVLPVICLTYVSLAFVSRQMRSAMLEVIDLDYIRTAKAKGLPERTVILKHALRNSLIPIITISAGLLPELIAGAIIIESIFTIPGMGTLTLQAIVDRDYPVINAVLFFSAFLTLLGILIADLAYAFVDPRISYS